MAHPNKRQHVARHCPNHHFLSFFEGRLPGSASAFAAALLLALAFALAFAALALIRLCPFAADFPLTDAFGKVGLTARIKKSLTILC